MPETTRPVARRRWRRVAVVSIALAVIAVAGVRHLLDPRAVTTMVANRVRASLGAELRLGGDAAYDFMPGLGAVLPGPALVVAGSTPLRADALRVRLPWRTLWQDRIEIERLHLVRPVLDLDALQAWRSTRPATTAPMPDVRFAVRVEDGTLVRGGIPIAEGVTLELANSDDLAAWLARWNGTPGTLLPPLDGHVEVRSLRGDGIEVDGVRVDVRDDARH